MFNFKINFNIEFGRDKSQDALVKEHEAELKKLKEEKDAK
jgi:hypothetical protein